MAKLCVYIYMWASLVAQMVKRLPAVPETWVQSLGREDPMEKEIATQSSTLAWKNPRGSWKATVHGVAKSRTWLSDFSSYMCVCVCVCVCVIYIYVCIWVCVVMCVCNCKITIWVFILTINLINKILRWLWYYFCLWNITHQGYSVKVLCFKVTWNNIIPLPGIMPPTWYTGHFFQFHIYF